MLHYDTWHQILDLQNKEQMLLVAVLVAVAAGWVYLLVAEPEDVVQGLVAVEQSGRYCRLHLRHRRPATQGAMPEGRDEPMGSGFG